jgi:hypothetical protein
MFAGAAYVEQVTIPIAQKVLKHTEDLAENGFKYANKGLDFSEQKKGGGRAIRGMQTVLDKGEEVTYRELDT